MDFASLLNMASKNADNASKTLADLKSKEIKEKQEKTKQFNDARLAKRAKLITKEEANPEKKFTIPKKKSKTSGECFKEVSVKMEMNSYRAEKTKVTMHLSGKTIKKEEKKEVSKIAGATKRPAPLNFGSLMKAAEDNSQGKKINFDCIEGPPAKTRNIDHPARSKKSSSLFDLTSGQQKHMGGRRTTSALKRQNLVQTNMWGYVTPKHQLKRKSDEQNEDNHDDDEYDSDFIDDSEDKLNNVGRKEFEETLKMVNPKYDKNLWKHRERTINDRDMVSDYRTIVMEEARSARLGVMEDRYEAKKNKSVSL